jgi:hypothetical protein
VRTLDCGKFCFIKRLEGQNGISFEIRCKQIQPILIGSRPLRTNFIVSVLPLCPPIHSTAIKVQYHPKSHFNKLKGSRVLVNFFPPTAASYVDDNKIVGIVQDIAHHPSKQTQTMNPFVRWWEHLKDLPSLCQDKPINVPKPLEAEEAVFCVSLFHVEKTVVGFLPGRYQ